MLYNQLSYRVTRQLSGWVQVLKGWAARDPAKADTKLECPMGTLFLSICKVEKSNGGTLFLSICKVKGVDSFSKKIRTGFFSLYIVTQKTVRNSAGCSALLLHFKDEEKEWTPHWKSVPPLPPSVFSHLMDEEKEWTPHCVSPPYGWRESTRV